MSETASLKKILRDTIVIGSTITVGAVANNLGTSSDLFSEFTSQRSRSEGIAFPIGNGDTLVTSVESYSVQDGYLAIKSAVNNSDSSSCMMKGSEGDLYGWVVLHDQNVAYEYTTQNGEVIVESVPVEKIFPICTLSDPSDHGDHSNHDEGHHCAYDIPQSRLNDLAEQMHIQPFHSGMNINKLQSMPGTEKILYLNIDQLMNGDTPSKYSAEGMYQVWQSAAASLSMFNVNVTTDKSVYNAAVQKNVRNTCIAKFYRASGRSFAPLHSFGTTNSSTLYAERTAYGLGRTTAHEVGHQLGLLHDGGGGDGEYFGGISSYKWAPIMGNYWPGDRWGAEAIYQWSTGEYSGASNKKQDDLTLIENYIPKRKDDFTVATPLIVEAGVVAGASNIGQITDRNDTDEFTFRVGSAGGSVDLTIDRLEYLGGGMLDVEAELTDESGTSIVISNPKSKRSASIREQLQAGSYTLTVRGGSEGTPRDGFSNYSSLGYYIIDGSITGTVGDTSLTVATPGIGESFEQGETCPITWSCSLEDLVTISLLENGETLQEIIANTANDDEHFWEIPETVPAGDNYSVEIKVDGNDLADTSELFSITEEYIVSSYPFTENFDALDSGSTTLPIGWNQSGIDDINWLVLSGPTPSKIGIEPNVTGPSGDYPNETGKYLYIEASSENNPLKGADIISPKFAITEHMKLSFMAHMFSDSAMMGELSLDISVDDVWENNVITLEADSGDTWFPVSIPLDDYQGERVQFRFSGVTGTGWASDIAIDLMEISVDIQTAIATKKTMNSTLSLSHFGNKISYTVPANLVGQQYKIALYNLRGQQVAIVEEGISKSGISSTSIPSHIGAGYYICRISTGALTESASLILTR